MKSQMIVDSNVGYHNMDLQRSVDRLSKGSAYRDLSTICIVPTRGVIPAKVVQSWMGLFSPMNQKFIRLFMIGLEVGVAYSAAIENILANPELSKWKYILTLEEDNMPPPDGLIKLYENMDKYDVISGLYWTKGEMGQPMIYGDTKVIPKNFLPQLPILDTIQECNGLGMGFTLFKLDIFKNPNISKPWFRTVQEYNPGVGSKAYTQDLFFFENAGKVGYRFAVDNRVKVGHYDYEGSAGIADTIW